MARPLDPNSRRAKLDRLRIALPGQKFSPKRVRNLEADGVDLNDPVAVEKWIRNSKHADAGKVIDPSPPITAEDIDGQIAELKENLLAATEKREAETINIKIRGLGRIQSMLRDQGKYILADDAEAEGMRFGLAAKRQWEDIEDSLPPILEGLTALQMKTKLREFAAAQIVELHEFFQE